MKREESFDLHVTVPMAIDAIVHAFATVRGCSFHRVEANGVVRGSTSFNLATYGEALTGWAVPLGATTRSHHRRRGLDAAAAIRLGPKA